MPFRERSFWLAVGALAYVCFGSLPNAPQPFLVMVGLVVLPAWLAETWRRTRRAEIDDRRLEPAALSAVRACHFGAALWIAARLGAPGHAARDAIANLAAAIAIVAALVALARLVSEGGLLAPLPSTRSVDAAAFAGLLWGIAVALPAARALFSTNDVLLDPLAIDYATTTAAVGSLLVLVAATWRLRVQRRLEIGVADRVGGALALSLTALCVAMPTAVADVASPDRVLPAAVIAASLACAWAATTREPTTVSTTLRGVLAIMILGVPTALFIAIAARAYPAHGAPIALAGSAIAIAVGLVARDVARPLGPEQSRWLDAIERASHGALQPDPDAAIRAALAALRSAYRDPNAKPELWRASPEEVLSVDVAGYLHVAKAKVPELLCSLAEAEPERTLRTEVLRALEVRRPEVRPLLAWFEAREAFCATTVVDEDGPLGFLLLPKGKRRRQVTLEEARAVRLLADRISALLAVSSALARSRERELRAASHATRVDAECSRLEQIITLAAGRHRALSEFVARPVRIATYSPAARFAIDELERHGRTGEPLTLTVPPGVSAAGWAALAHLASPGAGGPLVVADAATAVEHDEARWQDPQVSPLALADGGTLVVLDAAALPLAIQDHLARAIARRVTEGALSTVPPPMLIVTVREPIEALLIEGRLSRQLAARLGKSTVVLPPLAARAEDLRALVLDRLSGMGMREHGEPLGIEAAALAILLEHRWPGNDVELEDVLVRAAGKATGPVVTAANLASVGFRQESEQTPPSPGLDHSGATAPTVAPRAEPPVTRPLRRCVAVVLLSTMAQACSSHNRADPTDRADASTDAAKAVGSTYIDPSAPIEARVADLLSLMTLEEKVEQMHGISVTDAGKGLNYAPDNERLHIPGFRMVDGMRGVGILTGPATTFPVGSARGATFDPALEAQVGQAIGQEARAKGANVLLAPTINNLRHPRWGRAQETYGEDTFHIGSMAVAFIGGVQREIIASAKHFAANSIENTRFTVDVHMDERTLREVYLPHFKRAVDAGVGSVMSAYNQLNGDYCSQNHHLLTDILDGEWKFDGFVESDWILGTHSTAPAALAGLDIEMPAANFFGPPLVDAVNAGAVPMSTIDEAVRRILRAKFRFGIFDGKPPLDPAKVVESAANTTLARGVEEEAIVLLKNTAAALPLDQKVVHRVAVIGTLANTANIGDLGSSATTSSYIVTPLAGFRAHAGSVEIVDLTHDTLSAADEAAIGAADAAVVVVGLTSADEGEGLITVGDRKGLPLSAAQEALVLDVAAHNPRTVVVLEGSGAIVMENWVDQVQAIAMAWYPGLEGGNAIANALFGDVNPSGKLPVTFPKAEADLPPFINDAPDVTYGLLHGYRYVDDLAEVPRFAFGFGLSYTTFSFSNLILGATSIPSNGTLTVTADVTNTGTLAGDEVVQLYVGYAGSSVKRAQHELKGFARVHLAPGETRNVAFPIAAQDLAFYDVTTSAWKVEPLGYTISVGSSSRDLPLTATFAVK